MNQDQEPYYDDLEKWAEVFAYLSLDHPNLDAFILNDMSPDDNPSFTPSYLRRISQAKNRINPNLRMIPVLYFDSHDMLKYFKPGNPYKSVLSIDGVSIWYWGSYKGEIDMSAFNRYLSQAEQYVPPAPYLIGVYPIEKADLPSSKSYYSDTDVYNMIIAADKNSVGTILYDVPWIPKTREDKNLHDTIIRAFSAVN